MIKLNRNNQNYEKKNISERSARRSPCASDREGLPAPRGILHLCGWEWWEMAIKWQSRPAEKRTSFQIKMDQRCSCKWFITERSKVAKNVTRTFCFYQQRPEQKLRENISSDREFFFQTIDIQWKINQGIALRIHILRKVVYLPILGYSHYMYI